MALDMTPEQREIGQKNFQHAVGSLGAQAPANYETSFTEQYGSQELSSLPIEAGQSKTVKLKVKPPSTVGAGRYPVTVRASAEDATAETNVALEIVGQPRLTLTGREGLLSGRAEAGRRPAGAVRCRTAGRRAGSSRTVPRACRG